MVFSCRLGTLVLMAGDYRAAGPARNARLVFVPDNLENRLGRTMLPMNETVTSPRLEILPEPKKATGSRQVCPFCGWVDARGEGVCPQCGLEDTPGTRQATRSKVGPWFVLQSRNPASPGMNFATLLVLVAKGRVTPRSVVRGPTTHQLWRFAARVKGLARLFGICWGCGGDVNTSAKVCPNCKRLQEPPPNPDLLVEGSDDSAPSSSDRHSLGLTLSSDRQASGHGPMVEVVSIGDGAGEGMGLAAFELTGARRRPRFRAGRAVLWTLVLGIGALAVYFYLNPRAWQRTAAWLGARWDDLTQPAPPARTPATAPSTGGRETIKPPTVGRVPEVMVGGPGPATVPATAPSAAGGVVPRGPDDTVRITPPVPMTPEAARARAGELRREAFDAANNRDWARAVRCWEEMLKLPKEARHSDLEIYLNEARRQLQLLRQP
jgi:hypothetical protein